MSCADLFDLERLPQKDRERYGQGTFGQHTLLARHLVENGAPFVMVANGMPWDCHVFQHEIYQMLVPDLDNIIFQLITDLKDRDMLDNTLVVMMGEFGRAPGSTPVEGEIIIPTPGVWPWQDVAFSEGVVVGATDADGIEVVENPFNERNLLCHDLHRTGD